MARDTTHITDAADDFDGYAASLRTHATTLGQNRVETWTGTVADLYRANLDAARLHLGTLATRCEAAATSLRAHATAVGSSDLAEILDAPWGIGAPGSLYGLASWGDDLREGAEQLGGLLLGEARP